MYSIINDWEENVKFILQAGRNQWTVKNENRSGTQSKQGGSIYKSGGVRQHTFRIWSKQNYTSINKKGGLYHALILSGKQLPCKGCWVLQIENELPVIYHHQKSHYDFWIDKNTYTYLWVYVSLWWEYKLYSLSRHIWRVYAALPMTKQKLLGGYSPAVVLHLNGFSIHFPNFIWKWHSCKCIWGWRTHQMAKLTKPGVVSYAATNTTPGTAHPHQAGNNFATSQAWLWTSLNSPYFATSFLSAHCFLEQLVLLSSFVCKFWCHPAA